MAKLKSGFSNDENEYQRSNNYFLEARDLTMHFPAKTDSFGRPTSFIHAADGVNFAVPKGKTMGVVGESGCGKSTVGKMLLNIYKPTSGSILYEGRDITKLSARERKPYVKKMQLVWQDPYSSLDPRLRAGDIIAEGLDNFHLASSRSEREAKVERLMKMCGLFPEQANNYPHQFSGGQRQRICIARALSTDPEFVVCDEAVSALDVSIQAQIINLLKDLQDELKLTYLFISHDLNIVHFISDEILVMYLGQVVERGTMESVYRNRAHPYTQALFSATPAFTAEEKKNKQRILLEGDVPSPVDPPAGCRFRGRCPYATAKCAEEPQWYEVEENHIVKCHLFA
ncbi:MAG: oligopeptide/dipeptide ABC transporter ATP-binding protein [Candidatus Spyradocola sp.]|nr:oligopeptide/dipeptide ABC transporter ATP-binding protein [Candidatus Spyradocola sp.]